MKKIFLIGDSIRLGYDVLVKEAYKGTAEVYYPWENCRFAEYVLRNLHEWKQEIPDGDDVDCVHWNVGLWDTLILYNDGVLTPIDVYEQFMRRICKRIKLLFPKAKVIFATSTPMAEELFKDPDFCIRYNKDTEAYNEVAVRVAKEYGHEINDLYALLKDKPVDLHSDVAHYYTKNGAKIISEKVLSSINECLGIQSGDIDFDKWFSDTDSYEGGAWLAKRSSEINAATALGI